MQYIRDFEELGKYPLKMNYLLYSLLMSILIGSLSIRMASADSVTYINQFVLKVKEEHIDRVIEEVKERFGLSKQRYEIVPTIYVFDRNSQTATSNKPDVDFLKKLSSCCNKKLSFTTTYDDIGVLKAWDRGYSGHGITIVVTGVGIDTNLDDLKPNVNVTLCYNAMDEASKDVAPRHFPSYPKSFPKTDHENNAAGLAAAARNDKCGDGVAYSSKLVGVKIFNVKRFKWNKLEMTETHVARGLGHAHDTVDIYSNSWSSVKDFGPDIGMATKESIKRGIEHGRGGRGSVYVFPVGGINDGYDNNMHTITVNGVGKDGITQPYTGRSASILTSTYGEASRSNTDLKTTSHTPHSQCISSFRGTSAATPIVAGIGALILEANPNLSWRDVQHVMVKASETSKVEKMYTFRKNGARHLFHDQFGFGMLNAWKAVKFAETWTQVPEQRCVNVIMANQGCQQRHHLWLCDAHIQIEGFGKAEHVRLVVSYQTPNEHNTKLVVISPSNTTSVLLDYGQSKSKSATYREGVTFLSVNFWDERVVGTWTVILTNRQTGGTKPSPSMSPIRLYICGTGNFSQTHDPKTEEWVNNVGRKHKHDTLITVLRGMWEVVLRILQILLVFIGIGVFQYIVWLFLLLIFFICYSHVLFNP